VPLQVIFVKWDYRNKFIARFFNASVASRVSYGTTILKPKAEIIYRNAPLTRKRCVTLTLKRTLLPTHFLHEVSQAIILQSQQPSHAPLTILQP
jgi:hypothetical protein